MPLRGSLSWGFKFKLAAVRRFWFLVGHHVAGIELTNYKLWVARAC